MGRWYAELKKITRMPPDGTDKTDKSHPERVLSVLSVPVLGRNENFPDRADSFVGFVSSPSEQIQNFSEAEERAAILEHDAGLTRAEADRLAGISQSPKTDSEMYADALRQIGPCGYGPIAVFLGWGATRAANVEAELRTAGRINYDASGRGQLVDRDGNA